VLIGGSVDTASGPAPLVTVSLSSMKGESPPVGRLLQT